MRCPFPPSLVALWLPVCSRSCHPACDVLYVRWPAVWNNSVTSTDAQQSCHKQDKVPHIAGSCSQTHTQHTSTSDWRAHTPTHASVSHAFRAHSHKPLHALKPKQWGGVTGGSFHELTAVVVYWSTAVFEWRSHPPQTDKKDPQGTTSVAGFEVLLQKQLKGKQMQKEMAEFIHER